VSDEEYAAQNTLCLGMARCAFQRTADDDYLNHLDLLVFSISIPIDRSRSEHRNEVTIQHNRTNGTDAKNSCPLVKLFIPIFISSGPNTCFLNFFPATGCHSDLNPYHPPPHQLPLEVPI
jgi:hypothetical protein